MPYPRQFCEPGESGRLLDSRPLFESVCKGPAAIALDAEPAVLTKEPFKGRVHFLRERDRLAQSRLEQPHHDFLRHQGVRAQLALWGQRRLHIQAGDFQGRVAVGFQHNIRLAPRLDIRGGQGTYGPEQGRVLAPQGLDVGCGMGNQPGEQAHIAYGGHSASAPQQNGQLRA